MLGFLKLLLSEKLVCVRACVSALEAINYIHVILNLYNQLNKFVAFRNVTKLSMHGRGLCNEAQHDRNQSNKEVLARAMNKHFQFSNNIMLSCTTKLPKHEAVLSFK